MDKGKIICNKLKDIRKTIAKENGIDYDSSECTYEGPCSGTCPKCDAELEKLTHSIETLEDSSIPVVIDYPDKIDISNSFNDGILQVGFVDLLTGDAILEDVMFDDVEVSLTEMIDFAESDLLLLDIDDDCNNIFEFDDSCDSDIDNNTEIPRSSEK